MDDNVIGTIKARHELLMFNTISFGYVVIFPQCRSRIESAFSVPSYLVGVKGL